MNLALIQGAITGLQVASDLAIGLGKLNTLAQVQAKSIELGQIIVSAQSATLSAYSDQAAMIEEVRALKEEIVRVKAWEAQKQRYKLTNLWDGAAVVYALKESMSESEPAHWICTKCYEDGSRMILQPRTGKDGFTLLACPACKSEIHSRYREIGPADYV